ncbi:MAG TPA: class I SAM-dependent methyltransferase [Segetibacter sp.]
MLTKLFLSLTNYPAFRRLLWKPVYELLSKKFTIKDWSFMNYGFEHLTNEPPPTLEPEDEINRYPIQLYHFLVNKINVAGLKVLEVGSGRGGGAFYIKKYLSPGSVTGVDIAFNAVKLANENYKTNGIEFLQGNAEMLSFEDAGFDVVVNVESSHAYGSVPKFLSEVKRVLRTGGYLLLADIRVAGDLPKLQAQLRSSGMRIVEAEDISRNVIRAIEKEEPIKRRRIQENIPCWMQAIFREFSGVTGSKAHTQLQSAELVYYSFVLRKY